MFFFSGMYDTTKSPINPSLHVEIACWTLNPKPEVLHPVAPKAGTPKR